MTESDRARHDEYGRKRTRKTSARYGPYDLVLRLDERMHSTPSFPTPNNVLPKNLVQIGIGGCQAPRLGVKGRERGWLDPSGCRPHEVLKFIQLFAERPLAGIKAVESCLVHAGHLPRRHGD